MKNWLNTIYVAIAAAGGYLMAINNVSENKASDFAEVLSTATYIELTHTLHEGIPTGPGSEAPTMNSFRSHDDGSTRIHRYNFPGQWGTHVDPPIHFIEGGRALTDISLSEMVLPLIVLDVSDKVRQNPDYQISLRDVADWEEINGIIPEKSFVALRTDWSKRWPDMDRIRNWDDEGKSHSPGWSMEVLKYLAINQNVTAIGHETMDTDPGYLAAVGEYPLETYFLAQNKYQIENMTALDQLPPTGAFIVATWALPKDGSGFPARVFAIIP